MNVRPLLFMGLGTVWLLNASAPAALIGSSAELVDKGAPAGFFTCQVFLDFDNPMDQVIGVGGLFGGADVIFSSTGPLLNDGGVLSGFKIEDFPLHPIGGAALYDSFVTIGEKTSEDGLDTDYSPGFAGSDGIFAVIAGTSWMEDDGGWYDSDPGTPVFGPSVLIAQFTLPVGESFTLSGLGHWRNDAIHPPGEFSSDYFEVFHVPAPGAFGLLGLTLLNSHRRRARPDPRLLNIPARRPPTATR